MLEVMYTDGMHRISVSLTDAQVEWLGRGLNRSKALRLLVEWAMVNDVEPWRKANAPGLSESRISPTLNAEAIQRMTRDSENMQVLSDSRNKTLLRYQCYKNGK